MQDQDKPQPKKDTKSQPKAEAAKPSTGGKRSFASLIAVIAVIIAAIALYQVKSLRPQMQQIATQRSESGTQLQQQFQQAEQSVSALQTQMNELQKQQADQLATMQAMNEQLQSVKNAGQSEDNRWVIKQAIFLIQLAHLNQQFGRDRAQTIDLLNTADQQIISLNEPALLKVRQTLAEDISRLKAQPSIDKAGLLSQLSAMAKQAETLPLRTPIKASEIDLSSPAEEKASSSKWKNALKQTLATLQKIVIIRHRQEPIQAVMGPQQYELLVRTLAYQLQQAQWALLQDDAAVFKQSLMQAKDLVTNNLDISKPETKSFLAELDKLQQIELVVEKVELQTSLKLLKQYLVEHAIKNAATNRRAQ